MTNEKLINIDRARQIITELSGWTLSQINSNLSSIKKDLDQEIVDRQNQHQETWNNLNQIYKQINGFVTDKGEEKIGIDKIRDELKRLESLISQGGGGDLSDLGTKSDKADSQGTAFARIASNLESINYIINYFNTSVNEDGGILDDKAINYVFNKTFESQAEADALYKEQQKPEYIKAID